MDRTVVVSGGGTGIGLAVARRFVREGDRVVLLGRREAVLDGAVRELAADAADGGAVRHAAVDLTDPAQVEAAVRSAIEPWAPVDVVVNNAGGTRHPTGAGLRALRDSWRDTYDANVISAVLLTNALLPLLRRPGGRVIAVSSLAALVGGGDGYGAAKAALHGWVFGLARELGPDGINVNVIAPGFIADTEFFGDRLTPELEERLIGVIALNRPGRPEDIAGAASYLAGADGVHVTGQVLNVNGGVNPGR